jgi:hypothetical protein
LFQDQGFHVVLEPGFFEVSHPAVRRDQREIAAKQHTVFQQCVGVLTALIYAPDGRTVTLGGQSVGSWFGEGTLLRNQPRRAELIALRHSRFVLLTAFNFPVMLPCFMFPLALSATPLLVTLISKHCAALLGLIFGMGA